MKSSLKFGIAHAVTLVFLGFVISVGAADEKVTAELAALESKVPSFKVQKRPDAPGELILTIEDSLTIDDLRGVVVDDAPPVPGALKKPYAPNMTDDFPQGEAPYFADGIEPFRFEYFNCEFNYGGWHTFAMADYASAHGFNIVYPYVRKVEEGAHLPEGTKWLSWGNFINWHTWFAEHDLPAARYDLLADLDLVKLHVEEKRFKRDESDTSLSKQGDSLMIDLEHPVLSPGQLRAQPWFPKEAGEAEQAAFEKRYYDGYAQTYTSAVEAARLAGWKNISIYGWQPYGRTWGGLEKPQIDPGSDHAWNAFGKQIYESVDLVHNSVYCFYWSARNVAYTLAGIDANRVVLESTPEAKPLRPYYWTLCHGGGGGWRWWRGQPLTNEETRAMIAMSFFTGVDGFDTWNWSGTGNHNVAEIPTGTAAKDFFTSGMDVMLGQEFAATPVGGSESQVFERYDVLHLLSIDEENGRVTFQKVRPKEENYGVNDAAPKFTAEISNLEPCLRAKSDPVAAMVEGMALVKPLEYLLRHGEVKIDVPARQQFKETLPIVRRVKCGSADVLITYDPKVIFGGEPREIVLENFDGQEGVTLRLPADDETRVFVISSDAQR